MHLLLKYIFSDTPIDLHHQANYTSNWLLTYPHENLYNLEYGTIPALENRSSEIRASSLKHEFTDGYPKDSGSEVYSNATVTSIMDNISFIATSVSPTTTIMTARPTFATNTATTTTSPPTAATTTTTNNDDVDCSILNGNDNLQKPKIQYETIQLGRRRTNIHNHKIKW
ncbi:uncharacterized protein LOC135208191 [Macrobrachium nipponense]|uniref:uncharacterized protein LOC135208191 n=1 Tax=Macrobrachium nipponense TaxID=159736 RepID=UPI0030C7CA77